MPQGKEIQSHEYWIVDNRILVIIQVHNMAADKLCHPSLSNSDWLFTWLITMRLMMKMLLLFILLLCLDFLFLIPFYLTGDPPKSIPLLGVSGSMGVCKTAKKTYIWIPNVYFWPLLTKNSLSKKGYSYLHRIKLLLE